MNYSYDLYIDGELKENVRTEIITTSIKARQINIATGKTVVIVDNATRRIMAKAEDSVIKLLFDDEQYMP